MTGFSTHCDQLRLYLNMNIDEKRPVLHSAYIGLCDYAQSGYSQANLLQCWNVTAGESPMVHTREHTECILYILLACMHNNSVRLALNGLLYY